MKRFLIDQKIISLMLGVPEDDLTVVNFMFEYNKKIYDLLVKLALVFYMREGWTIDQMNSELDKFKNDPLSDEDSKLFMNENFVELFDQKVNEYNRLIYRMYKEKVAPDQLREIEEYIALKQRTIEEITLVEQNMVDQILGKLMEEYNSKGRILSPEEAGLNNTSK